MYSTYCVTVRKRERERERETHKSSVTRTLTEKLPHRIKASKHPKSWSTSIDPFKLDFYGKSNGCFQIESSIRISLMDVVMPIISRASSYFKPQNPYFIFSGSTILLRFHLTQQHIWSHCVEAKGGGWGATAAKNESGLKRLNSLAPNVNDSQRAIPASYQRSATSWTHWNTSNKT